MSASPIQSSNSYSQAADRLMSSNQVQRAYTATDPATKKVDESESAKRQTSEYGKGKLIDIYA